MPLLLDIRVGADREPDVVGVGGAAGEHLLAVDHVLVTVADGGGADRREIAAGSRFGIADGELDAAVQDCRQEPLFLFLGTLLHQRRAHRVERHQRDRRAHPAGLFGEDELLDRRKAASAIFFGPPDPKQIGLRQRADGVAHRGTALDVVADGRQAFGRHHPFQSGAHLRAQLLLFGGVLEVHRLRPPAERASA